MKRIFATLALVLALVVLAAAPGCTNDLDDGIPVDDNLMHYTEIGNRADLNFNYLAQRARSKATAGVDGAIVARDGVLNSVIVEAGAQLNGDIIIIDDSKGDKTIITK